MGEVYRARDSRLGRDVAIKVLPSSLSADSDRLRRFEQEARAAAALNHPNILAVFQMRTYEGAPYLVSELLEGETLREQIKRGRLPVAGESPFKRFLIRSETASRSGYTPDLGTPHECPSASRSERATAGTDSAKRTSVPPLIAIDRVHCRVRCWIDTPCFRAKDEALAVRTPPVAEGCSCFWSPSILQFAFDQCKFGLKDSCSPLDGSSTSMRSTLMHREP